jgi:hypothetical protein
MATSEIITKLYAFRPRRCRNGGADIFIGSRMSSARLAPQLDFPGHLNFELELWEWMSLLSD